MRDKQEILLRVQSTEASALKGMLEVLIDIRDVLVDMEASTQVYRCEMLRFKQWELDKK